MQPLNSILFLFLGQQRIDPLRLAVEVAARPEPSMAGPMLILSLATIAIGIGVVVFLKRVSPRTVSDDKLLFSELCCGNHLSRRQRKLLLDMARQKQVNCPSQMLMDVSLWSPDPNQPARWEHPKVQAELHRLHSLLFTQPKLTTDNN